MDGSRVFKWANLANTMVDSIDIEDGKISITNLSVSLLFNMVRGDPYLTIFRAVKQFWWHGQQNRLSVDGIEYEHCK